MKKANGHLLFILAVLFIFIQGKSDEPVQLSNLRCEMAINPEGIDITSPRLSWEITGIGRAIKQLSYQILVASTPEKLNNNDGDLWNSGEVLSDQSVQVIYVGKSLESSTRCYWKVKVRTSQGESSWSKPASWSMGLLRASDWKAKWIGLDKVFPWDSLTHASRLSARYLRKEFDAKHKIKQARVYITGLGLYELYVNGKKLGEQVLAPNPTDYEKTILYNTFDVTSELKKGKNTLSAVLGNGRYFNMRQNYKPNKIKTFGFPKMLFQMEIEYMNGERETIVSDQTWKVTSDGPIRSNNEWDGEEYDARKELTGWNQNQYDDRSWQLAELVKEPGGVLKAQMSPGMKIKEILKPASIKSLTKDTLIIDMGQNMAGWLQISVKGKKGDRIQMRFAESLKSDGRLYTANLRSAKQTDVYILKGSGMEIWEPHFVYHGFRYVEVTGYPGKASSDKFKGKLVYDDIATTGTFESSDQTLNQVFGNAFRGIQSNYKGMPVDCPQRDERQPWLGDRATGSMGESFLFNNDQLYAKWLNDIEDSQKPDGQLPDMSPAFYMSYYSDNMTWPATYIFIANMLYDQFGDIEPIRKHYASMKKWMDYMKAKYMKDFLVTKDKYGDWCVPPESKELIHSRDSSRLTDGVLIATAYYFKLQTLMMKFAGLLNKKDDVVLYSGLNDSIETAFNRCFLKNNSYSNGTVTANILPLKFGMVPENARDEVFNNIVEKIMRSSNGHISSGVIGTQWLMRCLTENGRPDVAFRIATNRDYPSWGYMVENGATTIWELWNGNTASPKMNSQNHVMLLGDLLIWYYENLAGIKEMEPGFKKILMKPSAVDGLDEVNASFRSIHGMIKSNWKQDPEKFTWKITIPANTSAKIYIPAHSEKDITESGKPAISANGVKFTGMEDKMVVFEIGSGDYEFVSSFPWKSGLIKNEFIFQRASFPESHAATLAETPKGLVAAWFGGTKEGNKDVCIWVSRLVNGKWTAPAEAANGIQNDSVRYACWNPVLYQVPNGKLLLFYKVGPKVAGWKGFMKTSDDHGITWSAAQFLPEGFLGPVKNKPVLLSSGELLCPSSTENNGWKVHFEITRDWGKTWEKIGPINDGKTFNAIQPSILSYSNGKLQVLCRSRNRAILESSSLDQGRTWSEMTPTSLPNNNSGTDAVTLKDGRQILVYNHVLPPDGLTKGPRTPLNVAVSEDGKTWYAAVVLEDSPISQYSYPSVIQTSDGLVHVVYTWRRLCIKHAVIDPAKLKLVPIENGKWPI